MVVLIMMVVTLGVNYIVAGIAKISFLQPVTAIINFFEMLGASLIAFPFMIFCFFSVI